jgi:hypothetical protein
VPRSSESKVREERFVSLRKNCEQLCVYRTSPILLLDTSGLVGLPDKSGTVTGQVWSGILSSTFDYCFKHNMLTVSSIDPSLFSLGS